MRAFQTRTARYLLLIGLFLVGLGLRLYTISTRSLWLDESFSVWMADQPLRSAWRDVIALDQHPPLYYTLLHGWTLLFGNAEFSVRGFSALWGALTVPVMYLIGERLGGRRLGVLAALVFLAAPIHVAYAQDARMYSLLTFNAACAILCTVALISDPAVRTQSLTLRGTSSSTRRWWIGWIIFSALVPFSHNTAILYFVAVGLWIVDAFGSFAIVRRVRGDGSAEPDYRIRNWSTALVVSVLIWSLWLPGFISQSLRVDNEFWIPAPTRQSIETHWYDLVNAYGSGGAMTRPLLYVFGALVLLGVWKLRRKPVTALFLLLLLFIPFAGELLVSLRRPIFYTRTLIWTSLPLYVLIAAGLAALRFRPVIVGATLLVLVLNGAALVKYYDSGDREGWRDAAMWVAPEVQPGDLILFNAGWVQIPFNYYYERIGPPVELRGLPADMFDRGILEPIMVRTDLPRLEQLTTNKERVWLVYSHNWYTDPQRLIPPFLDSRFRRAQSREFAGLQVFLYVRR